MKILAAIIESGRPRQASKNLFIFTALLFANRFTNITDVLKTLLAFLLFLTASAAVYIYNDLLDIDQDKLHPRKCKRPLASGRLPVSFAWFGIFFLVIFSELLSFFLGLSFVLVLTSYLILQVCYCNYLKNQVLLDVFAIAFGFVLRVVAGAFAIHVHISHWLLLCSLLLALFLAFGKRRQELVLLGDEAHKHRSILGQYGLPFLDQLIMVVVSSVIVSYSVYSIESSTAHAHPHLWLTIPVVLFGVFRYMYLVYQCGWGGAPEEVILKDRSLQLTLIVWAVLLVILFLFDHAGATAATVLV